MRPSPRFLLSLLACAAFISASSAQQNPQPTPEQQRALKEHHKQLEIFCARSAQVSAELAAIKSGAIKPGADWAGEYSLNLGQCFLQIAVAPRAGMAYTVANSEGALLEYNCGQIVEFSRDSILVRPERSVSDLASRYLSERLYFVRWGELKLLLSQSQLVNLIDSVRERRPIGFNMLIAESSRLWLERQFPKERPHVPEQFEPLFSSPAIAAKIADVQLQDLGDCVLNGVRTDYYTVSFDKGRLDRVQPNSMIITPDLRGSVGELTVSDHTTHASVIVQSGPDFRVRSAPQVGDTWYILIPHAAP